MTKGHIYFQNHVFYKKNVLLMDNVLTAAMRIDFVGISATLQAATLLSC